MTKNENINIWFGDWGSYDDWGLQLEGMGIGFPTPRENKISVPGRDGTLDLSEVLSPITYEDRQISFTFSLAGRHEDLHTRASAIANKIHGKKIRIIVGTDPGYYYEGRMKVEAGMEDDVVENIILSGEVYPYKYEINDGTEDWLWDPFDLENGVIREYKDLMVAGQRKVVIIGRRKPEMPEVICDTEMTLKYGTMTIQLPAGRTKLYELMLGEGEHELVFPGNGTVTISYRGGSL